MPDLGNRHASEAQFYDAVYSQPAADEDLVISREHVPSFHCGMEVIGEEMLAHMGPLRGKRILKLGCGGGECSPRSSPCMGRR